MVPHEPLFWDIETTGFNPLNKHWYSNTMAAQVTCVAIGRAHGWREAEGRGDVDFEVTAYWDSSEYNLLQVVSSRLEDEVADAERLGESVEPFLVGWNSRGFDHPYIGARFARLRLDGHLFNHKMKRLDMMRALGNDEVTDKAYPAQDDYAKALDIPVDDELTGEDMPKAFEREDWQKIEDHAESDVLEMMKVFVERREPCFEEFYGHYDEINREPPKFNKEVEF